MTNITEVLARVFVPDLDAAIFEYIETGDEEPAR
jgi:hypothetical protein